MYRCLFTSAYLFFFCTMFFSSCKLTAIYDSDGYARIEKKGKIGLIDKSGNEVLPFIFDSISLFHDGLAVVEKNSIYGVVNSKGETVVPLKYVGVIYENGLFIATEMIRGLQNEDSYTRKIIIDRSGVIHEGEYTFLDISPFAGDYACASAVFLKPNPNYKKKNESGEIDSFPYKGTMTLYGLIDKEANTIIPFAFEDRFVMDSEGLAVVKKDGKYGMIDKDANIILPYQFDESFHFDSEGYAVVKKGGKYGMMDKDYNTIIPIAFDSPVFSFEDGIAVLQMDGKYGAINKASKVVIPFSHSNESEVREALKDKWLFGTWRMSSGDGNIVNTFVFHPNGKCNARMTFNYPIPNVNEWITYSVRNDEVTLVIPGQGVSVLMRLSDKLMVTYNSARQEIRKINNNY